MLDKIIYIMKMVSDESISVPVITNSATVAADPSGLVA